MYSCHLFLISSASVRSILFLCFIEPIFAWNVPLVSLIFLKRSLVFLVLLFSSISLHWSLRKAFLSLLPILWNSAFRWLYLSFFSFAFHFSSFHSYLKGLPRQPFGFFCISFPWGWSWSLSPVQCHEPPLLSSDTLSIRSCPLNLFLTSTVWSEGIWFRSYLYGLLVFSTFFNLSLNLAMSSWSEPQSAPSLVFADCIEFLHLWLQRI